MLCVQGWSANVFHLQAKCSPCYRNNQLKSCKKLNSILDLSFEIVENSMLTICRLLEQQTPNRHGVNNLVAQELENVQHTQFQRHLRMTPIALANDHLDASCEI